MIKMKSCWCNIWFLFCNKLTSFPGTYNWFNLKCLMYCVCIGHSLYCTMPSPWWNILIVNKLSVINGQGIFSEWMKSALWANKDIRIFPNDLLLFLLFFFIQEKYDSKIREGGESYRLSKVFFYYLLSIPRTEAFASLQEQLVVVGYHACICREWAQNSPCYFLIWKIYKH